MNWEHQVYSFGYPNAPPLTPNKTPTGANFPSPGPTFQTPQTNTNNFELHSGWTPTFADEYSVFNSNPGHTIDTQRSILDAHGHHISNQHYPLSASEDSFPSSFPPQIRQPPPQIRQPDLDLPPVEASRRLSSSLNSPSSLSPSQPAFGVEEVAQTVTPTRTKGRLEETPSTQTATPPNTATKSVRKLAAKPNRASSMSQPQGYVQGSTQQGQLQLLDFSNTSMDVYGYPMSAPATALGYSQGKSFWDPDSSMTGMEMQLGHENHSPMEGNSHKQSNSLDWTRSNQIFQTTTNKASFDLNTNRSSSIAEADSHSQNNFNHTQTYDHPYEHSNSKDSQFASPTRTGVVNPGLLFSFPATRDDFQQEPASSDPGNPEVASKQPYQHQLRESRRDQEEELRRSRPSSQSSIHSRDGRAALVSPTRASSRAGLKRSASTSSNSIPQSHRVAEQTSRSRERRSSPVKAHNRSSLMSIPESAKYRADNGVPMRADISFTIDPNGRARTETTITVSSDRQPLKRSASLANGDWDDSPSESSSDEEIIIVPSRYSSFRLPGPRSAPPKMTRLERNYSKRGRGSSVYSHSSGEQSHRGGVIGGDPESEAETVVEQSDELQRSGDATSALKKVLEDRKRINAKHAMTDITPTRTRRRGRTSRFAWEGIGNTTAATTPTSNTDGDMDTPSTDRSGTTRCVCGGRDGNGGFMIQCESCMKWLHANCVKIDRRNVPHVYICSFCTSTPGVRGRLRDVGGGRGFNDRNLASSPLTRKSFR